jgi:hypothetical protein
MEDHLGHLHAISYQDVINVIVRLPSGDLYVYMMCRNIIFQKKHLLCCSCIIQNTLSLLFSCKLFFALVGLKMSLLPLFLHCNLLTAHIVGLTHSAQYHNGDLLGLPVLQLNSFATALYEPTSNRNQNNDEFGSENRHSFTTLESRQRPEGSIRPVHV